MVSSLVIVIITIEIIVADSACNVEQDIPLRPKQHARGKKPRRMKLKPAMRNRRRRKEGLSQTLERSVARQMLHQKLLLLRNQRQKASQKMPKMPRNPAARASLLIQILKRTVHHPPRSIGRQHRRSLQAQKLMWMRRRKRRMLLLAK